MPDDRHLTDATVGEPPSHHDVQQLIEAERGLGVQGVRRAWQASDSDKVVLTSDASGVKISRDDGTTAPAQVIVDGTAAGGQLSGTYPNPSVSTATIDALIPPGTIWAYAGLNAPPGWLLCTGVAVSRQTYLKLWTAIGAGYGPGDGVNTFNIPNLVGRVVLGYSGLHPRGEAGGTEAGDPHTHTGSHSHGLNNHSHGLNNHTHAGAAHQHGLGSHTHLSSAQHDHALGATHTHGMTNHDHNVDSHFHNATALGVGGSTGSSPSTNGLYAPGGATSTTVAHAHDSGSLDVTGQTDGIGGHTTGVLSYTDGLGNTGGASTSTTGARVAGQTGVPSPIVDTGGATAGATGVPSPTVVTAAATGLTATDASAPAAEYTQSLGNLPPYQTALYIIRTGN